MIKDLFGTVVIDSFSGKYDFLSNFYACEVFMDGLKYPSTEAAYQAAKTLDQSARLAIRDARSAGQAKRLGGAVELRKGWEGMKVDVMRQLLEQKFSKEPLRQWLLDTGNAHLVEANRWGDVWWGVCDGVGKNWLGRLLMELRTKLQAT